MSERPFYRRDAAVRFAQATLLYLVAGFLLYASLLIDIIEEGRWGLLGKALFEVTVWPRGLSWTGIALFIGLGLGLYAATVVLDRLHETFIETLATVPSRRTFVGFLVLAATVGAGVGLAADPAEMQDHAACQDLPETATPTFEGVYQHDHSDGELVYFAGGFNQIWFYDAGWDGWYVTDFESGYGRTGYAYEATAEWGGDPAYIIANDTSLTLYRKNATAIGTQGATVAEQYEFVARCRGETDG